MTYHQLSQHEKDEIFLDSCEAFESEIISEFFFRRELAKLGYNATDIENIVREHRPKEDNDGDFG